MLTLNTTATRLYIHVPFCTQKCGYCAFYSEEKQSYKTQYAWLKKIIADLKNVALLKQNFESIFIGGGTPNTLDHSLFEILLKAVSRIKKTDSYEWTIESNPESLTDEKLNLMIKYGVNRLSIGIQTFSEKLRLILQRQGNVNDLPPLLKKIKSLPFKSVNVDLIYGIPTQTQSQAKKDILRVLDFGVEHLSCYALTPDEGCRLYQDFLKVNTDRITNRIWYAIEQWIAPYGLKRYEISNYAKPNFECQHNLGTWLGEPYLGIGPSATSFNGVTRSMQVPDLAAWLQDSPPEIDILSPMQRADEIFAFGLRTVQGWFPEKCLKATGHRPEFWIPKIREFMDEKYLILEPDGHLFPTEKGLSFWDTIAQEII